MVGNIWDRSTWKMGSQIFPKRPGLDLSKTGQSISFQVPRDMPITKASNYPPGVPILPPRKTTLSILDAYSRSTFKLVFPFIDDLLFADTITLAYSRPDGPATLEHLISKCCVLASLSLTDLFRTAADEFPDVKTDACAHEARHILTSILEEPNITTLQSVLILVSAKHAIVLRDWLILVLVTIRSVCGSTFNSYRFPWAGLPHGYCARWSSSCSHRMTTLREVVLNSVKDSISERYSGSVTYLTKRQP